MFYSTTSQRCGAYGQASGYGPPKALIVIRLPFVLASLSALAPALVCQVSFNPASGATIAPSTGVVVTNGSGWPGVAQWYDSHGNPVGNAYPVASGVPGGVWVGGPPES